MQGIRANQRTSAYAWPRQQRPNAHSWKIWQTILRKIYCSPSSTFLKQSFRLRRWINCSTIYHHYLYSPLEQEIYQQRHFTNIKWFASAITRKSILILPSTICNYTNIPSDAYPIKQLNPISFHIETSTAIITPSRTFFHDFADYIKSMPSWISSLISNFTTNPLSDILVHYIQHQTPLYISNDRSRTHKKSGGGWTISLTDGTEIILGWNPDFG